MNKQNRVKLRYREHVDGCQVRGGLGRWVKEGEGIKECRSIAAK